MNDKLFSMLVHFEDDDEENESTNDAKAENICMRRIGVVNNNPSKSARDKNEAKKPKQLTNDQIRRLGLDPNDDKDFLNELVHFYDFNLKV